MRHQRSLDARSTLAPRSDSACSHYALYVCTHCPWLLPSRSRFVGSSRSPHHCRSSILSPHHSFLALLPLFLLLGLSLSLFYFALREHVPSFPLPFLHPLTFVLVPHRTVSRRANTTVFARSCTSRCS